MAEFKENLRRRALAFFKEEMRVPKSLDQLSTLSCDYLKEISQETSEKLKTDFGIKNINELAQIDLDQNQDEIEQSGWDFTNFEKWVLAARIISRIAKAEVVKAKKVILIGLENAGKSAIRETIVHKYQSDEISFHRAIQTLQPTRGVERETISIFNNKLHLWDMGGQKQYRESYLKEPEKFLLNISAIIFVIDVQDSVKYNIAIDYIRNLAEKFHSLNENPPFIICFHKFDPNIQHDPKYIDEINKLWENITAILNEHHFQYKKFNTSIFDDFSVFHFFSEALNTVIDLDVERIINMILEETAHATGLNNLMMLSESGLRLGEFIEEGEIDKALYEELYQLAIYTIISFKRLNSSLKKRKPLRSLFCSFFTADKLNFLMTRIVILKQSLYLVSLHPEKKELDNEFVLTLMPWLSNLFVG